MTRRFGEISTDESATFSITFGASADYILLASGDGDYGNSPFAGAINGAPVGETLTYDGDSGETSLGINMVLHNTTKGERAKITATNRGANTITCAASSPDSVSGWDDNDVITTASQTNLGRGGIFIDVDITAWMQDPAATAIYVAMSGKRLTTPGAGYFCLMHPCETYAGSKELVNLEMDNDGIWLYATGWIPVVWIDERAYICVVFYSAGDNMRIALRYGGEAT